MSKKNPHFVTGDVVASEKVVVDEGVEKKEEEDLELEKKKKLEEKNEDGNSPS